jgi:hypothetical protein
MKITGTYLFLRTWSFICLFHLIFSLKYFFLLQSCHKCNVILCDCATKMYSTLLTLFASSENYNNQLYVIHLLIKSMKYFALPLSKISFPGLTFGFYCYKLFQITGKLWTSSVPCFYCSTREWIQQKKLFKVKTVIKSSISETVFLHPKLANWLFQETKKWRQKIGCFSFDRALSECLKHWTKKYKITCIKRKRKINPKKCNGIKRKKVLLI